MTPSPFWQSVLYFLIVACVVIVGLLLVISALDRAHAFD